MEFVNFDDVRSRVSTRRSGGGKKSDSLVAVSQVFYHEREKPARITTIRFSEDVMNRARLKNGDRIDVFFTPDYRVWKFKTIDDPARGYAITSSTKTSKVGIIKGTWYEGLPLLGGDLAVTRAKMLSDDTSSQNRVSIGEIIISFQDVIIEEMLD